MPGQMSRLKRFLLRQEARKQARYHFVSETDRLEQTQRAISRTAIHTKSYGVYSKPKHEGITTTIPLIRVQQRILKHRFA